MKKFRFVLTALLLMVSVASFAQNVAVRGTVTDEKGEAVPFATVQIKGTSDGAAADVGGVYSLNAPSNAVLVFSAVGYKTVEVAVNGKSLIDVILENDNTFLDEVVVTAYGTSTKGSFTGSAATIKGEKIQERQVDNVTNALSGQVAGVQVLNSNGQPGTSSTILIRGVGSLNAGTKPLIVVDGVPFDGDLASIPGQDIESVTVQKDAVSTALYGARGANGVIMVTTRKGKTSDAKVTFEGRLGQNSRAITNYDVLTSTDQYITKAYEAIYNSAYYSIAKYKGDVAKAHAYANNTLFTASGGGTGYPIYTVPDGEYLFGTNGKLNPNATLGYNDGSNYLVPDDWASYTFQNKLRQEYNVNISAATDKLNYYASFGFLDNQGIITNSGFTRFSGRLKADYQVKKWFKVGANAAYTYSDSQYPGEQTNSSSSGNAFFVANYIAPIYPLFVRDANENIVYNTAYGTPVYDYGDAKYTAYTRSFMQIANPLGDLTYNKEEYLADIFNLNWFGEINPFKGFTFTAKWGLHVDNTRYNNLGNQFYGQSAEQGGYAYQASDRFYGLDQQYVANYKFNIGKNNSFDVTAGYDGYSTTSTSLSATGNNLYNPDSFYIYNTIDNKNGYGSKTEYGTQGFFAFVNYNFAQKYFATFSYRRDASSRFAPDKRWGNFFSGSAAWVISNEDFLKNSSWVNFLKLKGSYGQQGNDNIGNNYAYLDQFSVTGADGVFSDGTLVYKGNPDLTWETQNSYNVGVEFNLFNNVVSGAIEYFGRQSDNMLYNKPVAPIAGYSTFPVNVGSLRNTGVEFDFNFMIFNKKNFTWDFSVNATVQQNKIIKLSDDVDGKIINGTTIWEEGYSRYRMYLVKYAGVNAETGEALYWAKDDEGVEYTTVDYSDASSTNKTATDDLLAKVYGGFSTGFTFFGFNLSAQFAYQLGGKMYDSGYSRLMHQGNASYAGNNWHTDILNSWTPENPYTDVPRVNAQDKYTISTSDRWLISSDYLSVNNITFGYTFPSKWTKQFGVEKLNLNVVADNVALFSARKGLDPRQSFTSSTTAIYTPIRTISGGLKITF